jgi:hypothetical protein
MEHLEAGYIMKDLSSEEKVAQLEKDGYEVAGMFMQMGSQYETLSRNHHEQAQLVISLQKQMRKQNALIRKLYSHYTKEKKRADALQLQMDAVQAQDVEESDELLAKMQEDSILRQGEEWLELPETQREWERQGLVVDGQGHLVNADVQ